MNIQPAGDAKKAAKNDANDKNQPVADSDGLFICPKTQRKRRSGATFGFSGVSIWKRKANTIGDAGKDVSDFGVNSGGFFGPNFMEKCVKNGHKEAWEAYRNIYPSIRGYICGHPSREVKRDE